MNPFDNIKGISDVFGVLLAILGSSIFTCGLIAMRQIKHRVNMWAVPFYVQIIGLMAAPVLYTFTEIIKELTKETPLIHITISGKIAKRDPEALDKDYEIKPETFMMLFMIGTLVIFAI
jgi:hypothetical protein